MTSATCTRCNARLTMGDPEETCAACAAELVMPGQTCVHKKGGRYVVTERRAARRSLLEGDRIMTDAGEATVTDTIHNDEQIVVYRSLGEDAKVYARPARIFDELGRFTFARAEAL